MTVAVREPRSVKLRDGTSAYCLHRREAWVLDDHVQGYLRHGITVERGDVVFDVGANIGLFGLRMNQRCEGVLTLLAFEPIPEIRAVTEANLVDWPGSRVMACGLSSACGEAVFTYYPNTPSLSTMADPWADGDAELREAVIGSARHSPMWYSRLMPRILAGPIARRLRSDAREIRAVLRTVSDVMAESGLDRIDLLKVDCEGAELDVLRGIDAADWPKIRQLVLEVHDHEGRLDRILEILASQGFSDPVVEKEPAFRGTALVNLYARRECGDDFRSGGDPPR